MTEAAGAARVLAQAKINLFLRILAREESGYHLLETLFCRLELGDVVTVQVGGTERTVTCEGPAMPPGGLGAVENNLAYRAAEAYVRASGWDTGFRITIEKHIPVGGGLGGGSADAAAVLRALDAMRPLRARFIPTESLAMSLGSDVPYLVNTAPLALAWGRGERMLALPALPRRHVVLLVPGFGVSTADAYGWLASDRPRAPLEPALMALEGLEGLDSWQHLAASASNDLEPLVAARHPDVAQMLRALEDCGASLARMSGSGSTVFGIFEEPPDEHALESATGCRVLLTRTAERVVPVERLG
ncbi:MAG: 4-(cytidine 5'-diphospho)-2-C-methyl-D-erythritol kinase [Gemmatimonadaceae bacterium]